MILMTSKYFTYFVWTVNVLESFPVFDYILACLLSYIIQWIKSRSGWRNVHYFTLFFVENGLLWKGLFSFFIILRMAQEMLRSNSHPDTWKQPQFETNWKDWVTRLSWKCNCHLQWMPCTTSTKTSHHFEQISQWFCICGFL